ncbi:type III-B CRISPR module RAMP protein Cmr4 [Pseudomonas sp. F1_0610]|uniref:type III-B CRISPR module RAMP protein Cmr4 n=1 Tax=Pseudomonas sp. F1_0610 TaxID=3114284 RepID=UPI0039C3E850
MTTQSTLMLLTTETSLHAGSGQSVAGIDLPIQREAHTGWPCVFGSSMKGALRAHAQGKLENQQILDLFGPEQSAQPQERDSNHAGALLIGDAQLLALPVRSLQSRFKWVTSPACLQRFFTHAERLGVQIPQLNISVNQEFDALGNKEETTFLEEFKLEQKPSEQITLLAQWLSPLIDNHFTTEVIEQNLLIVHDDIFTFLTRHATAINPHIAIDSETKSVKTGALWYEESLPSETLLYVPISAHAARRKESQLTAQQVLAQLMTLFPSNSHWLQIGGNETTGMGWCRVNFTQGEA